MTGSLPDVGKRHKIPPPAKQKEIASSGMVRSVGNRTRLSMMNGLTVFLFQPLQPFAPFKPFEFF